VESRLAAEAWGLTGASSVSGLDEGDGPRYASCARLAAQSDLLRASMEARSSWHEGRMV